MSRESVATLMFECRCPKRALLRFEAPPPQSIGFAGGVKSGGVLRAHELLECVCGHRYAVEVELPVVEVSP